MSGCWGQRRERGAGSQSGLFSILKSNYMLLNWISSGPIIWVPPRGPIIRVPPRTMTGHTREQGMGGHTSLSGASKYIPDYCAAIVYQVSFIPTLVDTIVYIFLRGVPNSSMGT